MAGFKKQRISNIVLDASQTARQDLALSVGEVTNTIDVSASAAQAALQTENGGVGEVIDGKKIVDLPLNGRNFVQLAQLIPGVNTGTSGSITVRRARGSVGTSDSSNGSTAIQVNGQRDTQNRYSIDGIESMDYDAFTYSFSTSVDSIAEFRVDTSSSGPEGGAAAGANVNQIIKSGTNKIHGTLFEFNRNNVFTQTYDTIAKVDAVPARLNRNQFGGNIGGPVVIPHVYNGHDRTFFFINAETGFALNGANPQKATVPDASVRSGVLDSSIFEGPLNSAGQRTVLTVIDPFTSTPYKVGDKITLNANSAAYLAPAVTPLPTIPGAVNPLTLATNYSTTPVKTLNFQHEYIGRVDHTLGKKDSIGGHYIYDDTFSNGPSFFGHDNDDNDAVTKHFAIFETHQFSSTIVNDFRYGRQDFKEFETFGTTNNPAYNIANGILNIPFSSSDPHFFGGINPTISGNGQSYKLFSDIRNIGPRNRSNGINQFVESLSWQKGKHFMKFGADLGLRKDFFSQARDPHGTFNFDGRYTGSALLDFLLGYVATDSINPTVTRTNISSLIQAYSFQDNWTVHKGLTFNLGIRWDHYAPYTQDDDKYADIYTSADGLNPGTVATPANSPYGRGLIKPTYHDFQPRIGFAWQPYDKMVVRGAYGLYFTPEIDNVWFAMAEGAQAQAGAALTGNPGLNGNTPALKLPNISFTNPFPGVAAGGPSTYPFAVQLDQNLQDQVTSQFNVFVQMQLPSKFSAEVGYVGAIGRHNFVTENVNIPVPINPLNAVGTLNSRRPNQNFPRNVQADFSNGSSSYNSLQTKVERRVGRGLNVLASYTWSKSISGAGDIGGAVGGGFYGAAPLNVYAPRTDRSVSLFDVPHRFIGTVLYDIPFFQHSNGFKKALLSGFQVSTILSAVSGIPAAITDTAQTTATGIASRADRVVGVPVSLGRSGRTPTMQFNTAAFTHAQPGEFGTSARTGAVRLPGLLNDDFSATKGIQFGEGRSLQIRADFFNLFKHYNPDPATIGLALNDSGKFGKINDGISGGFATRIIQLGAKLYF